MQSIGSEKSGRSAGVEGSWSPRVRQRGYDERIRPAHVIRDTIASPIFPLFQKMW